MEHVIYSKKLLKNPSFFQKLLGQKLKENVIIEINNLLARNDLSTVTIEEVQGIAAEYNVNLSLEFSKELMDLYKIYLQTCLEDKYLSKEELNDLKNLKFILGLNDKEVDAIHQELAGKIYKDALEKVLEDHKLEDHERVFIENLQNDLKLSTEVTDRISKISSEELMNGVVNNAVSDEHLSPEDEEEIKKIADNLKVELNLSEATKKSLEKFKLFWQIQNNQIPTLEVSETSIPRKEKVYFQMKAKWYEEIKPEDQTVNSKSSLNIKIAKGEYWRKPNKTTQNMDAKIWEFVDEGNLFLTDKRLVFRGIQNGLQGDRVLLLNRVMDFNTFGNGIKIDKESGNKDIFLNLEANTDILAMLLGKAISQLS